MNDETKSPVEGKPADAEGEEATATEDLSGFASLDPMAAANEALKAADIRIAELEADLDDAKDRALRAVAEMENLRRRTVREVRDGKDYAIAKFATDILSVGDNLQRALSTVSDEMRGDSALDGFVTGVEMTERDFLNVLERNKVVRFDPEGERFDPNAHQAMFEIDDATVPAGTVMQVMQAGYKLGERVLRPAFVGVSKGGPKMTGPKPVETEVTTSDAMSGGPNDPQIDEDPAPVGAKVDKTA